VNGDNGLLQNGVHNDVLLKNRGHEEVNGFVNLQEGPPPPLSWPPPQMQLLVEPYDNSVGNVVTLKT